MLGASSPLPFPVGDMVPCAGRGGPLLEDEPPLTVTESGVVDVLDSLVNRRPRLPPAALEVALTAAAKLTARLPSQVSKHQGISSGWANHPGTTAPCICFVR
jgi:hypothetical protein